MKKEPQLAGLHLWEVAITYMGSGFITKNRSLWIITDNFSTRRAAAKAENFLRSRVGRESYPCATIASILAAGTIDA